MTRWDAELAIEQTRRKKAEENRRYRSRHRQRERLMQPFYYARWAARQHGLQPPPLPDWDKEFGQFEIHFRPGPPKGSTFKPRRKILSWRAHQKIYNGPDSNLTPNGHSNTPNDRPTKAVNQKPTHKAKASTMARTREVGHIHRHCLICGRPFRRFKSQIVRPGHGYFCSLGCRDAAGHLFRLALATDRLEPILEELAAALKANVTS
jgi:hypothetical protein